MKTELIYDIAAEAIVNEIDNYILGSGWTQLPERSRCRRGPHYLTVSASRVWRMEVTDPPKVDCRLCTSITLDSDDEAFLVELQLKFGGAA